MTFTFLHLILGVMAVFIIILVMLQDSKSDGASGALMGGGLNLFEKTKERGLAKTISTMTMYLVVFYLFTVVIMKML